MFVAYVVTAVVLSVMLVGSAAAKFTRQPSVVASLSALAVPASWFAPLGVVEIAGAFGLLAGIALAPLGVAAAVGVALYFLGALGAHLRAKDTKGITAPAGILVLALVVAVLRLASA
jgi:DoxX-like family